MTRDTKQRPTAFSGQSRPKTGAVSSSLVLALFVVGVLLFAAVMGGATWWIHRSAVSRGNGSMPPRNGLVLPGDPGAAGDPVRGAVRARQIRLYFTSDGARLQAQAVDLEPGLERDHQKLRFVVEKLLEGPDSGMWRSPIPTETKLRACYIVKETAVLDFSEELVLRPQGGAMAELLCVYAIVNTVLENIDSVKRARILVEGKSVPVLWDQLDLSAEFAMDVSLVRR
jgi:hypothetical protein